MHLPRLALSAALLLSLTACASSGLTSEPAPSAEATLEVTADAVWQKLPTVTYPGKQDDVFFVDASLGFYVNGQGKIYRTRDGGATWQKVLDQPGTYFRAIGMLDAQHGYAGNIGTEYFPNVSDTHPLYETIDGGDSWHKVEGLPGTSVKGICAIDVLHAPFINAGVLDTRTIVHAGGRVGSPAQLLRSLDGGRSWTNIDMGPWVAMIVDVKFFDAMNGIVFAGSDAAIDRSHALIVRTSDGGKSWEKVYESSRPFEITWKGSFPSPDVGYATIQNYNPDPNESQRRIVKTIDGGRHWQELALVNDSAVREFGIGFATPELGWVGTNKGGFETRDGGLHWQPVELGRAVNKIRILPQGKSFIAHAIGADVYRFGSPLPLHTTESKDAVVVEKP